MILIVLFLWTARHQGEAPCFQPMRFAQRTLILDAGHGGEDGGAISLTGTPESQINLAIVLKMRDICGFWGIPAVLTRAGDYSLKDSSADTIVKMKRSDLEHRVELIEASKPAALISIHQNIFSTPKAWGTQVFYAPTGGSEQWGVFTQSLMADALQPENTRRSKQITEDIFLMNHITCPAILVECGFLSNGEEARLLEQDEYQCQLALVIADSYLTYSFASE